MIKIRSENRYRQLFGICHPLKQRRRVSETVSIAEDNRGFSLTEVLAGVAVSTILISLAAIAIITFYNKFTELSYYADLQQQGFEAIETMKYGYPFSIGRDAVFLGIANTNRIELEDFGTTVGIKCIPDRSAQGHAGDYVRFYWHRYDKALYVEGQFGPTASVSQTPLFPHRNDDRIEVTRFQITPVPPPQEFGTRINPWNKDTYIHLITPQIRDNPRVILLEMDASVIYREGDNEEEERRKDITYRTIITRGR